MLRAFIAVKIECTPPLRRVIGQLTRMGKAIRAVSPDALHITLKFFGDVEEAAVADIAGVLTAAAANAVPCTARLIGMGAFPFLERPSVIWAGLQDAEPLIALARELETNLVPLGFKAERRAFHPHLTLARVKIKPPETLFALVHEHEASEFGAVLIDSVELLQSELRPEGPRYTTLARVELGRE